MVVISVRLSNAKGRPSFSIIKTCQSYPCTSICLTYSLNYYDLAARNLYPVNWPLIHLKQLLSSINQTTKVQRLANHAVRAASPCRASRAIDRYILSSSFRRWSLFLSCSCGQQATIPIQGQSYAGEAVRCFSTIGPPHFYLSWMRARIISK